MGHRVTVRASVSWIAAALMFGCAAAPEGDGLGRGGVRDGKNDSGADAGTFVCRTDFDCAEGEACRVVGDALACVPVAVVEECGLCPAPGRCIEGECVQPDEEGEVCEFDDECVDGKLCVGGRCTPHPCPGGSCMCTTTGDCPIGRVCESGSCIPDEGAEGCFADSECPSDRFCEAGRCVPRAECEVENPELSGEWSMTSTLPVRDAIGGVLDFVLDAGGELFRFLSGDTSIPEPFASIARGLLEEWLPSWAVRLIAILGEADAILSTWKVEETMTLVSTGTVDQYRGVHRWSEITFEHDGRTVRSRSTDVGAWGITPEDFYASATCGVFAIERHSIGLDVGRVVEWFVDTLVEIGTDGEFTTLRALLDSATRDVCDRVYDAVSSSSIDFIRATASTARGWCTSELSERVTALTNAIAMTALGIDSIDLRGSAPIASPRALEPGRWQGHFLGDDFVGSFRATR